MNRHVLKTMLALVVVFLSAIYVLKIFLPEQFVLIIENKQLIAIGQYVDSNLWLYNIIAVVTSFISYWFYLGAVLKKYVLHWKELIAIAVAIAVTHLLYEFNQALYSAASIAFMLLIPMLFKAEYKPVAIVFSTHYLSQTLSLLIRDLPSLLINVNFASIFLLTAESYLWLLLFYLYYNYKEGLHHG